MDASSSMKKVEPGGYLSKQEKGEKLIHDFLSQQKIDMIGVALFSENIHILQPPSLGKNQYINIFTNNKESVLQSGSNIFGAVQTIKGYFPKHSIKNTILVITDGGNTTINTGKENIYTNDIHVIILCLGKREQSTDENVGCKYIAKEMHGSLLYLSNNTTIASILVSDILYNIYISYNIYALICFSLYIGYYIYHKKNVDNYVFFFATIFGYIYPLVIHYLPYS